MAELSRFFGIIIRMFAEAGAPHKLPHFHAYYGDLEAVYVIRGIEILRMQGSLPRAQERLVLAWAYMHVAELSAAWDYQITGATWDKELKINPLQ